MFQLALVLLVLSSVGSCHGLLFNRFPKILASSTTCSAQSHSLSQQLQTNQSGGVKLGVLLLNLGGPETLDDVEGFLYNLFSDPDIIRLPPVVNLLQKPIAFAIAKTRSAKSSEGYKSIGGGSPIVKHTTEQAQALQQALQKRIQDGVTNGLQDARVFFAMRYWKPYTDHVLHEIAREHSDLNALVVLPLYPQFSISTSGSSLRQMNELLSSNAVLSHHFAAHRTPHTVVPAWHTRTGYIDAMARAIVQQIESLPESERTTATVLFSAHGVPQSYVRAGDPYQRQIEQCVELISQRVKALFDEDTSASTAEDHSVASLRDRVLANQQFNYSKNNEPTQPPASSTLRFELSFQSRVGPVQWLRPYTDDMLRSLGSQGVRSLVVVPVSFVSEHIETLEEIDGEYRELAESCGVVNWRRVPALNNNTAFIDDLADLVMEAIDAPALSVPDALRMNFDDMQRHDALFRYARDQRLKSSS